MQSWKRPLEPSTGVQVVRGPSSLQSVRGIGIPAHAAKGQRLLLRLPQQFCDVSLPEQPSQHSHGHAPRLLQAGEAQLLGVVAVQPVTAGSAACHSRTSRSRAQRRRWGPVALDGLRPDCARQLLVSACRAGAREQRPAAGVPDAEVGARPAEPPDHVHPPLAHRVEERRLPARVPGLHAGAEAQEELRARHVALARRVEERGLPPPVGDVGAGPQPPEQPHGVRTPFPGSVEHGRLPVPVLPVHVALVAREVLYAIYVAFPGGEEDGCLPHGIRGVEAHPQPVQASRQCQGAAKAPRPSGHKVCVAAPVELRVPRVRILQTAV
mmetsp:Transcript_108649/g.346351  ORF Transcript_108649/g.346351 Transcript_108649/m.346351 type:complete len:324 (+) Transcript_108649:784-1755(+)